jgi:hypothetical protein
MDQTKSALGSSNYFTNESDTSSWYLASDYCPYNPTLCTWNHVMDPYCTQDLHSGQRTEASEETFGLYFSGFHVLVATLDELDKSPYNLKEATDIIVSGVSAGGIGVWMTVDYIAKRYPEARVTGKCHVATALYCTVLHCTTLHFTTLHCTMLFYTALHYTALHCTVLYCIVLYCIALFYTALFYTLLYS